MRILLTEGSGLTSRQVATRLGQLGHEVELLSSTSLCLSRFTRYVRRVHPVPRFGLEPDAWFEAANRIARERSASVLFPTHEQVTVLAARQSELATATVVPPFDSLRRVQDKISAHRCLSEAGVPQPPSVVTDRHDEIHWDGRYPVFVKRPISTASSGVRRADSIEGLRAAASELGRDSTPLLIQAGIEGPLAMVQAIADHGRLVARHSNLRIREGIGGGASIKESIVLPALDQALIRLIELLNWHGAISFDVILGAQGPAVIDVNPRIVEPMNAHFAGVELVDAMLALATGSPPLDQQVGRPGVRTRQLLLAILEAARSGKRRVVFEEFVRALRGQGDYANAEEELTPLTADPIAAVPVAVATAATLVIPSAWHWFLDSAVAPYALTAEAWDKIVASAAHPS